MYTYKLQDEKPICSEKLRGFTILSVGGQKKRNRYSKNVKK